MTYRTEVAGVNENVWSSNGLEYDDYEKATEFLDSLAHRWTGFDMSRIVPLDTPKNQLISPKDPLIYQNYRRK